MEGWQLAGVVTQNSVQCLLPLEKARQMSHRFLEQIQGWHSFCLALLPQRGQTYFVYFLDNTKSFLILQWCLYCITHWLNGWACMAWLSFSLSDLSCGLTGVAVRKYYQQFWAWYIFNFCKALHKMYLLLVFWDNVALLKFKKLEPPCK